MWGDMKVEFLAAAVFIPWGANETFGSQRPNEYSICAISCCIGSFNKYFSSDYGILAIILIAISPKISSSDLGCCNIKAELSRELSWPAILSMLSATRLIAWAGSCADLFPDTRPVLLSGLLLSSQLDLLKLLSVFRGIKVSFKKNKMSVKLPFGLIQIISPWPWL